MVNEFQLGSGVEFERIRRLTGYLGTLDRFNNAKKAEVADRVKHTFGGEYNGRTEDAKRACRIL